MISNIKSTSRSTLLVVTNSRIARIDFIGRRRKSVQEIWTQTVPPSESSSDWLYIATAHAIKLSPKPLGRVTLVSPLVWTDLLRLPADVIALSSEAELRQALAIEAEAESGLSAFESEIAFTRLDSDRADGELFCTSMVTSSLLERLSQLIRTNNARLHSLVHPVSLQLFNSPSDAPATIEQLRRWDDFSDPEGQWLEEFAERWCRHLRQTKGTLPNGLYPSAEVNQSRMIFAGGLITVATAVGCLVWQRESRFRLETTRATVHQLEQQQKLQNQTLAEIKGLETKLIKLRKETSDAQGVRENLVRQIRLAEDVHQRQNSRWSALLDALSDAAGDCWVYRIASDAARTSIIGISPNNSQAHAFAARLEQLLRDKGWVIVPAATRELSDGLYEFTITLAPDNSGSGMVQEPNDLVKPVDRPEGNEVAISNPVEFQS